MDGTGRFHSTDNMPLLSRLDHLDFIIKSLEGKQNQSRWGGNKLARGAEGQTQPMDTTVKEAYFKGTLLDRVASLENRLFQLCLELESSSTSGNSSQTSGYASSSQGLKSEPFCSLPVFNNHHQGLKEVSVLHPTKPEIQETSGQEVEGRNNSNADNNKIDEKRVERKEKACKKVKKNPKKKMPRKWPHLKILGC